MSFHEYAAEKLALLDCGVYHLFRRGEDNAAQQKKSVVFSPVLTAFTVYPRSEQELRNNEMLWRVVQESSFQDTDVEDLCPDEMGGAQIFALGYSIDLVRFLQSVSVEEMHQTVVYILADAVYGESDEGLQKMQQELAPSFWASLQNVVFEKNAHGSDALQQNTNPRAWTKPPLCIRRASFMLDEALQGAKDHDCWRMEINGTLFVPQNDIATKQDREKNPQGSKPLLPIADWCMETRAMVVHSMYLDQIRYSESCLALRINCERSGGSPVYHPRQIAAHNVNQTRSLRTKARRRVILETMMRLVRQQGQVETFERAKTVLLCANRSASLLGQLPSHIVRQLLIPLMIADAAGSSSSEDDDDSA